MTAVTNIELFRRQKGLSVKELAAILGVSPGAVSQWESGKKAPRKDRLEQIAAALDTSVDVLTGKKENPVHIDMDRVDAALLKELEDITPLERQKLLAFLAGLKANRAE